MVKTIPTQIRMTTQERNFLEHIGDGSISKGFRYSISKAGFDKTNPYKKINLNHELKKINSKLNILLNKGEK